MQKQKGNATTIILAIVAVTLLFGALLHTREDSTSTENTAEERTVPIVEQLDGYGGTKGERVVLENGEVKIDTSVFDDSKARFYNIEVSSGKTVYFFIVKDKNGILRAAANECQVCFAAKRGFRQEGDEMVCNNCGNRYPIEKIATEKGGCNPAPINPNLKIVDGGIVIEEEKLDEVSALF